MMKSEDLNNIAVPVIFNLMNNLCNCFITIKDIAVEASVPGTPHLISTLHCR